MNALEHHLSTASYVKGYTPSKADAVVFNAFETPPHPLLTHVNRWYRHILSYGKEIKHFQGSSVTLEEIGFGGLTSKSVQERKQERKETPAEEDDFDLFGSDDEESAEAEKLKQERLKAYAEKKAKKVPIIAKSNIILDVKPWDDETDMNAMEKHVRSIETPGLLWGASKLVPLAYGIKKLQISCVVDDKVGTDFLEEEITKFEDYVLSVDIAAFNKI